jgi:hypothetical protein
MWRTDKMRSRSLLAVTMMALALVARDAAASAAPAAAIRSIVMPDSLVQEAHGCHLSCEWGLVLKWHRHVGPFCRPIACWPRAVNPHRCWVDAWGVRHCRW